VVDPAACYSALVNVEVQDEKLQGLGLTPDRLRLEMAVGLYASEEVTLGQAAGIAGVSQTRFLRELGRRGVCIHYGVADFERDLKTIESPGLP
jgi:predicted HTH domain antitoxin